MGQSGIECGKILVDKLGARNPLDFSLFSTSPEFLIDQNKFFLDFSLTFSQCLMT